MKNLNGKTTVSKFEYWFLRICTICMFMLLALIILLWIGYWLDSRYQEKAPATQLPNQSVYKKPIPLSQDDRIRNYDFIDGAKSSLQPKNPQQTISSGFVIQVSASKSKENSDRLRAELILKNYPVKMEMKNSHYLIQIGPYATKKEAEKIEKSLIKDGYKTYLLKK